MDDDTYDTLLEVMRLATDSDSRRNKLTSLCARAGVGGYLSIDSAFSNLSSFSHKIVVGMNSGTRHGFISKCDWRRDTDASAYDKRGMYQRYSDELHVTIKLD